MHSLFSSTPTPTAVPVDYGTGTLKNCLKCEDSHPDVQISHSYNTQRLSSTEGRQKLCKISEINSKKASDCLALILNLQTITQRDKCHS